MEDFDSQFNEIVKNNGFPVEEDADIEATIEEAVQVLGSINETAMIISDIIMETFENKGKMNIPQAALGIFRALHLLSEEFAHLATGCTCEEEEGEEQDGE